MNDYQNYTSPVCHIHPANWTWQLLQLRLRLWPADEALPLWSCLPVPPGADPAVDRPPALPSAAAGAWGLLAVLSRWLGPFTGWPWSTALTSAPLALILPAGISKLSSLTSLAVSVSFGGMLNGLYWLLLVWRSAIMQEWLSRCSIRMEWELKWEFVLDDLGTLYIRRWRSRCRRNLSSTLF